MTNEKEAIAIIGIGCRFPGAENPEAFWKLLRNGKDAVTEMSPERATSWRSSLALARALAEKQDAESFERANISRGGFLKQVDRFDPEFFGIPPVEAASIDPQHRLLLEVTWEALEDAGKIPQSLAGSATGVFIGISSSNYDMFASKYASSEPYAVVGVNRSVAANRISYCLDLTGPSVIVSAACSSSLVAVDLACQSIRRGESTMALVGGVNAILTPHSTMSLASAGLISPSGRCKAFDAEADGFVRAEGAGAIVLKPLSQAKADGDLIYAVIRGSAVNHNGRSNGIMAPNPRAQEAVLREAYRQAGISPSRVRFVEAQATGTKLGDPMEMKALGAVFAEGRSPNNYCAVGSVKTNIGHTEGAAGIAGLIKVALSLDKRQIPPSLHFHNPNPIIPFDKLPLRVPQTLEPLDPRGAGGDKLDPPKSPLERGTLRNSPPLEKGTLKNSPALEKGTLKNSPALEKGSFTSSPPFLRGVGGDLPGEDLTVAGVSSFSFGGTNAHVVLEEAAPVRRGDAEKLPEPTWQVLTLSAKTAAALQELAGRYRDFLAERPEVSIADVCFSANTGRSLFRYRLVAIASSAEQLQQQLDDFATGKKPKNLFSGNAKKKKPPKIAFVFSNNDTESTDRGKELYETQPIFRQAIDRCDEILHSHSYKPLSEVLFYENTGESNQLAFFALQYALVELWKSWGIEPTVVTGSGWGEYAAAAVAGIFSLADALKLVAATPEEFGQVKSKVIYSSPRIDFISSVTGNLETKEVANSGYWSNLGLNGVKFANAIPQTEAAIWLPSFKGESSDAEGMLQTLGELYLRGVSIDWQGFYRDYSCGRVRLPTYPFQRDRYWLGEVDFPAQSTNETDASQLIRELEKTGELSAAEMKLLPKLLELLGNSELLANKTTAQPTESIEIEERLKFTDRNRLQLLIPYLQEQVAKAIGVKPERIDVGEPLSNLGFNSLMAMELSNRVKTDWGVDLQAVEFIEDSSISDVAGQIAAMLPEKAAGDFGRQQQFSSNILIPLQPEGKQKPLFLVHPVAGVLFPYRQLAQLLGKERPIYGLQSVGLDNSQNPLKSLEEMARRYVEEMRSRQPQGPYLVGGWSFGAIVAFEIAVQLERAGEKVELVAILDQAPNSRSKLVNFQEGLKFAFGTALPYIWPYVWEYFAVGSRHQGIASAWQRLKFSLPALWRMFRVTLANCFAFIDYRPSAYSARVTLFVTKENKRKGDLGWEKLAAGGVEIYDLPGHHLNILRQPHLKVVAEKLKRCLSS